MSQTSTSLGGANFELGATLLVTSNSKYQKIWRKSLYIGFLISVKKPTTSSDNYESPPSPAPYTPLLTSEPPARTSSAKSFVEIDVHSEIEEVKEDVEERVRSDIERIVKQQDLKSLLELGGVDFISSVLAGQCPQPSQGGGGIPDRLDTTIPALITSFCNFLLNSIKCNRCIILMLLISAGLSFAIQFKLQGPKYGWHDGVAIVFYILVLIVGSSIANFVREIKMLKLAKGRHELDKSQMVPKSDIVVGNMVCLSPGYEVPADGLLVSAGILVLEGEAIKSKHDSNLNPFLICGSKVVGGQGRMVVTSVGNLTNLADTSTCNSGRRGLLESLIEKPFSFIDKAALFISVLVALMAFIHLFCIKDGGKSDLPEMKGKVSVNLLTEAIERVFLSPQRSISTLTGLVTVTILCIQHGMPLVVSICLTYKIDNVVSKQDAVLKHSLACTTMGLVTVLCIDVSGGLIPKPMEVSRIRMGEKDIISKVEEGSETVQLVPEMLKQGVCSSVLDPEISLSPVCNSIVSWAEATWEMNMRSFTEKFYMLKHTKLNSDKKGSGVLMRKVDGNEQVLHLHWSGAASTILGMCSSYYDSEGNRHDMENQKIEFEQVIKEMEDSGLTSIAFAHRQTTEVEELEQDELILIGLIGLRYTCQESIESALRNLENTANIQIKLVSEDDIQTVKEIACELGIEVPPDRIVLEGRELQDLNGKDRLDKVDLATLMGGLSPEDKLVVVKCLQDKGNVVAFFGTRLTTSHTSVLKVTDVGIVHHDSLCRIVDRDSSGISIKCFGALKPIVMAGRSKYNNIQKFTQLQLTCTISGSVIALISAMFTGDSPLAPFQLIWVNFLMYILGALMMAMELTSEEQLAKQPSSESIVTKKIRKNIAIQVLYQVCVSTALEFVGHVTDREKKVRETMIFNTFVLCQLCNQLNTMQLMKMEVLKNVQSYCFFVALSCCILMQAMVIEYANGLAGCMRLNGTEWAICVLIGALSWVVEWTLKKVLTVFLSTNYASESITSPSFYLSPGFPVLMLLLFPLGLIVVGHLGINMAFR